MRLPAKHIRSIALLFIISIVLLIAPARHAFFFNLFPLFAIGAIVIVLLRYVLRGSRALYLSALVCGSLCIHVYSYLHSGVNAAFDSKEYWTLAQGFAAGHGLSGTVYRTPLYPVLAGLCIKAGDHSGMAIVFFQHLTALLLVPGVYYVGKLHGFSPRASCIAATLVAINSLLLQATGMVMTEIVFCAAVLSCMAALIQWCRTPTMPWSVGVGLLFAISTYIRELFFPVLACGIVFIAVKKGRAGIYAGTLALVVYFGALAPWCLRNYFLSGHYGMSASFGVQVFTKAITFGCLSEHGRYYKRIEEPLTNVIADMRCNRAVAVKHPEDDWTTNRIPHLLMDSLVGRHGYSYFNASALLGKAAIEGFVAHPYRYMSSVAEGFSTLLLSHRELYPSLTAFVPAATAESSFLLRRFITGMVYVSGWIFVLFPFALLLRKGQWGALPAPFLVVCLMYTATAAVQIGFTRYTIPWEPFKLLCAAFVLETILNETKDFIRDLMARTKRRSRWLMLRRKVRCQSRVLQRYFQGVF